MTRQEKILTGVGLTVFAAVVALVFRAYLSPSMLVEFIVQLCG